MNLSTRHPWLVQFAEAPRPREAGTDVDYVRTGMRVSMRALEDLRDSGAPVGPVLCCLRHGAMHIPVAHGTASWWQAAHSLCRPGLARCQDTEQFSAPCVMRFWLIPEETHYATTAPTALHYRLSAARSLMRLAAA